MKNCVNFNNPDVVKIAGELNVSPVVAAAKIGLWQSKNNIEDRFPTIDELNQPQEVKYSLKATDILLSDKGKQIFEKGKKAGWDLNKILTELQIPKEQKQLILDLGITDREQIALELVSNYSYAVEVNTAKESIRSGSKKVEEDNYDTLYSPSENKYYSYSEEMGWMQSDENNRNQEFDINPPEDAKPYQKNERFEDNYVDIDTQHYSNLTVPGGTNYTENEIATPLITPSIKGHAQFATDNGIGWFRSDEKDVNIPSLVRQQGKEAVELYKNSKLALGDNSIKTRRILEVQSDLFQKGRDKEWLSREMNSLTPEEVANEPEWLRPIGTIIKSDSRKNAFLNLLIKDNNWVTFFIKSIIQDSAKKGYEKVLFPTGNTASKVEGHSTLEEFKKQKENRIKELEKELNNYTSLDNTFIVKGGEINEKSNTYFFKTKEEAVDFYNKQDSFLENWSYPSSEFTKSTNHINNEINQLKQELERVEGPEGFGALKPIYNFYENTVKNVLNKTYGKNDVKVITDEYGNTWNEISLDSKRDESTILLNKKDLSQFESDENESIFSESVKEPSKVKEDNFEINKKLLFGNEKDTNRSFTIKEVLQNIINFDLNLSDAGTNLVFKSMNILNLAKTRVKIISQERFDKLTQGSEGSGTAVMAYNYDAGNVIYMTENSLKMFNKEQILESFIHEVAHNLSIKALINPVTFEEKEFHDLIFKAFEQYKHLGKSRGSESYGFTNEKEFVAELYSNAEFRKEIQDLDKGFWRKFKDAIRRLFGLPKSLINDELIESILLIESVEKFIENNTTADENVFKNDYSNSFNSVLFKKIEQPKNIELDTLDKQLQHLINKSKDRIEQLLARTTSSKNIKNKEDHDKFIKNFKDLLNEVETLEKENQWKAITSYITSFSNTAFNLKSRLDKVLYDEETDSFSKNIDSEETLEIINKYDEYLSAYDLLEDVKQLIRNSKKEKTISVIDKEQINLITELLSNLEKNHDSLTDHFLNVRQANAVREYSKPENNTRIVNEWKNKLFTEHSKLDIKSETKEEYFGRMIQTKYKEQYTKALEDNAKKIVYDPYFDISSFERSGTDLLNINSPLINLISNVIGKMRDSVRSQYHDKQFEFKKLFDKYSKEKGQNNQSKMYDNLIELSKNDEYYLKGEYSIDFLNTVQNDLYPILNQITELKTKYSELFENKKEAEKNLKKDSQFKYLKMQRIAWFKEHTVTVDSITTPRNKYRNKELTGVEKELLDYFRNETEVNDKESYNGHIGLIKNLYGATFYKLPSVTKTDLERTLEGDLKGQLKDKWTDLTTIKADDINYGEAVDTKNKEKHNVKIGYRGKIESKDQSLDLATVYRKETLNAINYKEKKANETKLKLFVEIARSKDYKKQSIGTGKWLQNKYTKHSPGTTFSGEHSQELKKIEGLLETHLYDVLSYSGGKVLGSNMDASKLSSKVNGFAANIAMTANIGSGVVNVLNGTTQMFIDSVGGTHFNKTNLLKAEVNYNKNIMNILADLNNPIKTSFHNQMLDMFDIMGGFDNATQEFIRNSYAKKLISTKSMNGLNEMGEHMMNCILTESILRGLKVMNSQRQFIDKEGNVVDKEKAVSLFEMLFLNSEGKLVMSDKVIYTNKNLDVEYHNGGKQHINYVIKKKGEDLFGVYDPLMKAEIAKHWWGKTLLMFKNFFMSSFKYRYKGFQSALKSKDELTEDDITFNNAEQEFTEGIYTSFIRFVSQGIIPALKGLELAHMKEYYNSLSDYEKANLKKTTLEIGLTMVILPILGMLLGAAAGDDDEEIYFALYAFRRLESELSQFRDPRELNRMIQNPIAANRFIQNSLTVISDIVTPLNFNPQKNEVFFDYLSKDSKHNNITIKHIKKITPFYNQLDKQYENLYILLDK